MTKVWILVDVDHQEVTTILSVHATREAAVRALNARVLDGHQGGWMEIDEHDVHE